MAQILLDHKCDPNQMNRKAQTPLMLALESGNFIFVDYLINIAKIDINADTSQDGKTLLHYFAIKSDEYNLVQTLIKLVNIYLQFYFNTLMLLFFSSQSMMS